MPLPEGEVSRPLGKAAPAPIEPTKEELRAMCRKLGMEGPLMDNVLAHLVAKAVFETSDPVAAVAKIAATLGQVMRRPPDHALQIMAPALKRAGYRNIFGDVRRSFESGTAGKSHAQKALEPT